MRRFALAGLLLPALLLLGPAAALLAGEPRLEGLEELRGQILKQNGLTNESQSERVCQQNGTKYRFLTSGTPPLKKKYSSVPCDVPCWSSRCVEVGRPCEDPSRFMCSELDFKNITYGDAAEPVFVDVTEQKFLFPSQEIPSLYTSMEISYFKHDPHLSATVSLKSAVPVQYLDFNGPLQTPGVDFDAAIKGASMMITSCQARPHMKINRLDLALELKKHLRVDSFGKCLHNQDIPADALNLDKIEQKAFIAKKYLFQFAFENFAEDDYVTEKMWDMLRAGTLPVYLGAPNIRELLPMKAFVNVADFKTADDLGDYLKYLAENKTAYMEYHKWRSEPLPRAFKEKWGFARVHSVCRVCRWAYAKREMLEWDSVQQRPSPPGGGELLVPGAHRRRRRCGGPPSA